MKKKSRFSDTKSASQGNTLVHGQENKIFKKTEIIKFRNNIPKNVRTLFRRKIKASDGLKTVKSVKKCLELRKNLEKSEHELSNL